ncbi:MAG: Hpt domain-containing protein [Lachnospiraceae bacterium]
MKDQLFTELQELGVDMEEIMDRFMDDKELYVSCLERFMEETTFEELKEKLESLDYEEAFNCAHSLKGVSANLGLHHLYDAVCKIVEPLREKQFDALDGLYDAVAAEKANVQRVLDANRD